MEKKPLVTAVFLAIGLLSAEIQTQATTEDFIILGGPSRAYEESYIVIDEMGSLKGNSSIGESVPVFISAASEETPVLQAALKPNSFGAYEDAEGANAKKDDGLPSIPNYFAQPATGVNWGKLHENNGVDIANSCGAAVVAAAEGMVVPDRNFVGDDWNGGYGKLILIQHPNGTKTRYAHLDQVKVKIGDYVEKKERIGTMGNTGNSTGCHLHFEVEGAKNPFAK